jgi:hypothetical protein
MEVEEFGTARDGSGTMNIPEKDESKSHKRGSNSKGKGK